MATAMFRRFRTWLFNDQPDPAAYHGPHQRPRESTRTRPWWAVMCLSGVDYFSTLGYQPGIAAVAAGSLTPIATLVLVLVTLCGALPVYRWVAAVSPHGAGSIRMLEKLLPRWNGKIAVLVLLGFACTDFMITITLSSADAATHLVDNPVMPMHGTGAKLWITFGLITLLAAVFLKGFREAIALAVFLAPIYLALNMAVMVVGFQQILAHPEFLAGWTTALTTQHSNPWMALLLAIVVFPKLALGMSGYETGVSVMTQIHPGSTAGGGSATKAAHDVVDGADPSDTTQSAGRGRDHPGKADHHSVAGKHGAVAGRIRGARKMLTLAAAIMAVMLLCSSMVTTLLIPPQEFAAGGEANGRALAYVAHEYMGPVFGSAYDLSTILILWFAGASALAGMLNLVPRYLPRYGMAPEWTRAVRPLILVFTLVAFIITWIFDADVDAQGGAYATGVLVLMTSAALAVTLSARHHGRPRLAWGYGLVTAVFLYTTIANVVERPDGIKIAAVFVVCILVISFASRVWRASELRITDLRADSALRASMVAAQGHAIQLIPHNPDPSDADEDYREKLMTERLSHALVEDADVWFVEVKLRDPSDFSDKVSLVSRTVGSHRVIHVDGSSVPTCLAGVALWIRDETGVPPDLYLEWSSGSPIRNYLRFLLWGQGQTASMVHEILRRAVPDDAARPVVHVM
ncbi:MAG: amino acid transporter [Kocuria rhizophila]|nr:MAG: amino acid transporter [Kocuria rhizophila]